VDSRVLFSLVGAGLAAGFLSAYVYSRQPTPQPPVHVPASNPFTHGVYANGIIESFQEHGQNTNIYPEVAGVVTKILVREGQHVSKGDVVLVLDDTVQRATAAQLAAQANAAHATLDELRAQPRRETLAVSAAQVAQAKAALATAQSTLDKQQRSYTLDPRSVSKQALDDAANAVAQAHANLDVAKRQYQLTKAGAWIYDIRNQEQLTEALAKAAAASGALLGKYTLRAPRDGVVLTVSASVGSYASPQGVYNSYTQQYDPVLTMGDAGALAVRCYVDEILVPRLPDATTMTATMFVRGTDISVPLQFARVQPYVTPKIQLSNDRTEKVDLRVLPVIFRFVPPPGVALYPGQLVDVYLADRTATPRSTR
jgi:HlyD family secretion protein